MKLQSNEIGDSQVPTDTVGQILQITNIIKGLADAISNRLAGRSSNRGGGELPCSKTRASLLRLCICSSTAPIWHISSSGICGLR